MVPFHWIRTVTAKFTIPVTMSDIKYLRRFIYKLEKNGYNENCRNSSSKPELLQSVSLFEIFC